MYRMSFIREAIALSLSCVLFLCSRVELSSLIGGCLTGKHSRHPIGHTKCSILN